MSKTPVLTGDYNGAAAELSDRILSLIPDNPGILTMTSVWRLFHVPGFECGDLQPSRAQAEWAIGNARRRWKDAKATQPPAEEEK